MQPARLCLLNPQAGGGRGAKLAPALQTALREADPTLPPLAVPASVAEARARIAALPPGSRVLLAGGDGTLQRLLPALLTGGHELALLPCGTGNDLARALGLRQLGWRGAIGPALHTPTQAVDIGVLQADSGPEQPFASSLCVGFDAAVGAEAHAAPRWLRGMPRYLLATFATLARLQRQRMQVTIDGVALPPAEQLFASSLNTPSYASGMPVAPGARIDDGELDLVLAGRFGRLGALLAMPLLLSGLHLHHPRIRLQRFRTLRIEAETPLALALDGEPVPHARTLQVSVRQLALKVVRL